MMKILSRSALILSLAALAGSPLAAVERQGPGDAPPVAVRIVNNHNTAVRVFAEDAHGQLHRLGRVARGKLVEFDIPEGVMQGHFRIKVYPSEPVWSLQNDDYGVKTNPLSLAGGEDVTVWLEPDLKQSIVEMKRS